MKVLVTGSAGFIGSNLVLRLLEGLDFRPQITLRKGLRKFAEWYKEFYKM